MVYHFHDTSQTAKVKQTSDIDDNRLLRPDASNLAAFLYLMQHNNENSFNLIESTIKIIAPFFREFDIKPLERNPSLIRFEWKHEGSEQYFNASHLSDGTLRMICLITFLLQPNPPETIIIDEPELGLHPVAISVLAGLIKVALQKSQVICSTQSVTLLNQFMPNDIIVVERVENESIFTRLDKYNLADWMKDYSLGEIWEKNLIGGRP
ncbi:MAG: AAA family ATPase [Ignavibacteria bacterium]